MKNCNQCGKCCTNYANGGLSASAKEIDRWASDRPDIYRYVADGKIWVDPDTGDQLVSCPFLEKIPAQDKFVCKIYYDRPDDCRYYPVNIAQMINDECEMLERSDLQDSSKAQTKLDFLMADSRPPCK